MNEWIELTDEDRERAFNSLPDMLDGFLKKWGWLHFAKAVEAICREKNDVPSPAWCASVDAELAATAESDAQPVAQCAIYSYELIDRFLRNSLHDDDYEEYSAALESIRMGSASPIPAAAVSEGLDRDGDALEQTS